MVETKQPVFLGPIQSLPENRARAGFFPAGRYHGFDQFLPRTPEVSGNYSIVVYHGDGTSSGAIEIGNATNTLDKLGYLVTRHGLVVMVSIPTPTEGIALDIPINSGVEPVFYLFIGSHAWAESNPGNSLYYESRLWVPSDPEEPDLTEVDDLGDTEFLLGYFKIMPGASDYAKVTLIPREIPLFSWKGGVPTGLMGNLARRDQDNLFLGFNSHNPVEGATYNPGNLTLTILSDSSLSIVSYAGVQEITTIDWAAAPTGTPLFMIMEDVTNSVFTPGGNIRINSTLPISNNSVFMMVKWDGNFYVIGSMNSVTSLISSIPPPVPPSYGSWVSWVPAYSTIPDPLKTLGEPDGNSTFRLYYRTNGVGGYVVKVSFQVNTAFTTPTELVIGDSSSPFPFNPPSGGVFPFSSGVGYPIVAPVVNPFSLSSPNPAYIVGAYPALKIMIPSTLPGGNYTTPEFTVSTF